MAVPEESNGSVLRNALPAKRSISDMCDSSNEDVGSLFLPTAPVELPAKRPRWADICDSSDEDVESLLLPRAPVIDSQISYSRMDSFAESRSDLTRQVEETLDLKGTAASSSGGGEGRAGVRTEDDGEDEFVPLAATRRQRMRSRARGNESSPTPLTPMAVAAATSAGPVSLPAARSAAELAMEPPRMSSMVAAADVPARRIRQRGDGGDAVSATTTDAVTPSMGNERMPEVTEEVHQQRTSKRRHALLTIKATTDYMDYDLNRLDVRPCTLPRPRTPDPEDRTVSKRSWEAGVMRWRSALRQWSAVGVNHPAVTAAPLVMVAG